MAAQPEKQGEGDGQQEDGRQGLDDTQQRFAPVVSDGLTGHAEGFGDQHGVEDGIVHSLDHVPQGQDGQQTAGHDAVGPRIPAGTDQGADTGKGQGEQQNVQQAAVKKTGHIEQAEHQLQPEQRTQEQLKWTHQVPESVANIHQIRSLSYMETQNWSTQPVRNQEGSSQSSK